ncbi:hypothetical protein BofuT4_P040800.1 [Botrytis cinerea T4]|uniref:Uncharacterized protein n=1 Tax=Botryotinia fuckeliana (strain T4) TaxID=999810 RepID=G2Y1C9_BOTF4|nr:hypothetical protein BofuT4_P040800.1 [Botrytis cinerea T4]
MSSHNIASSIFIYIYSTSSGLHKQTETSTNKSITWYRYFSRFSGKEADETLASNYTQSIPSLFRESWQSIKVDIISCSWLEKKLIAVLALDNEYQSGSDWLDEVEAVELIVEKDINLEEA